MDGCCYQSSCVSKDAGKKPLQQFYPVKLWFLKIAHMLDGQERKSGLYRLVLCFNYCCWMVFRQPRSSLCNASAPTIGVLS